MRIVKKATGRKKRHFGKTFDKIRLLSVASPRVRKQIVQRGGQDLLDGICECCVNVLNGTIPLTREQKAKLVKHKARLRKLAATAIKGKKLRLTDKKRLVQRGRGFLGALLTPVASLLGSLIAR
jgi:hypothetical protein